MAFGVQDERRVTLTVGNRQAGVRDPVQLKSKLFPSGSIWDISWWSGFQQLLMQPPAVISFSPASHSFCLYRLFTSSALTIGPELIPTEDEPSDFGRTCKWSWYQKLFEAEIVLDFFFLCPSVLLVKKKTNNRLIPSDCVLCKQQERPALELNKANKPQADSYPCCVSPRLCKSIGDLDGKVVLSAPLFKGTPTLEHKENQFC